MSAFVGYLRVFPYHAHRLETPILLIPAITVTRGIDFLASMRGRLLDFFPHTKEICILLPAGYEQPQRLLNQSISGGMGRATLYVAALQTVEQVIAVAGVQWFLDDLSGGVENVSAEFLRRKVLVCELFP